MDSAMKTNELIKALRDLADECEDREKIALLNESADRLEKMDERIDIMMADMDREWGKSY